MLTTALYRLYKRTAAPWVHKAFAIELAMQTKNSQHVRWLGQQITQNPLDLMTIQDTIAELRPDLIIETGTWRGGSSFFFGNLFDLLGTEGQIVTIDVANYVTRTHPSVTYLRGSSTSTEILNVVTERVSATRGPILVILDSDHSAHHVRQEMEVYSRFVTRGSYLLVQDGIVDTSPLFRRERPGPLAAVKHFVAEHPEFEVDVARSQRFIITDHPMGWLRRR